MNWDSVIDQLRAYGLVIQDSPPLPLDRIVRVRCEFEGRLSSGKRGWYFLSQIKLDNGEFAIVGSYGIWGVGDTSQKISLKGYKLSKEQRRQIAEDQKRLREAHLKEVERRQSKAAAAAAHKWKELSLQGKSGYLKRKKVAAHGVRYLEDGVIAVPIMNLQKGVRGLQLIADEKRDDWHGENKNFWPYGLEIKGGFHRIGEAPANNAPILLTEGYSTGASCYEATGYTTYIAFNAGNLLDVAQAVRGVYGRNPIVFCADDDWKTVLPNGSQYNTGKTKAEAAAAKVRGHVVLPKFRDRADKDTDFNDLHCKEGIDAVRKQIVGVLAPPEQSDWRDRLLVNREGNLKSDISNIDLVLQNDDDWCGVLGYCDFSYRIIKRKPPPYEYGEVGEWTDADNTRLRIWLSNKYGFTPKAADAQDAVLVAAQARRFHPVREYLNSLRWDGQRRVRSWLHTYLGADPNDYTELAGMKWLVSAVARVMRPGCKADAMIILEGGQGLGKSTALRILGGEWFTDSHFNLGEKDGYQLIQGVWICEMGELDSFNKAESTRAKQFMSTQQDRFRPSYGRNAETFPRQCVFAGTTNQEQYLKDATGNRRSWPVYCRRLASLLLEADRDQLWAEAVQIYKQGIPWYVEDHEKHLFEAEQEDRFDTDVWEEKIVEYLRQPERQAHVSISELMENALLMQAAQMKPPEQKRVAQILTRHGWRKVRPRVTQSNGKVVRPWMYERPENWDKSR